MNDDRARDLINAELDDELTATEQRELAALLETSAEARAYRDGMQEVHGLLSDLPRVALPEQLHEQITATLVAPGPVNAPNASAAAAWPAVVRYGLAASLGLMLAVGFYEARPAGPANANIEDMVGTMAPGPKHRPGERMRIEGPDLRGNAALATDDQSTVLHIDLDTEAPVDIDIDLAASGFRIAALAQASGAFDTFSYTNHVLRARSQGRQSFAVVLQRDDAAVGGGQRFVGLAFSRNGETVEQGRLQSN